MMVLELKMILPIGIILGLGCCSSLLVRRWISSKWISALCGAGIATVLWVGGVYLMFGLTDPDEDSGPLLFTPILMSFLTALISAAATLWIPIKRKHRTQ